MKGTERFVIIKDVVSLIIIVVVITGIIYYCSQTKNEENERKARFEFTKLCKDVNEKIIRDLNRSENISDEARESIKWTIGRIISNIQSDIPLEPYLELWEEIKKELLVPNSWYKIIDWPEIIYRWEKKWFKDENTLVFKYKNGKEFYYLRSEDNNSNKIPELPPLLEVTSTIGNLGNLTAEEFSRGLWELSKNTSFYYERGDKFIECRFTGFLVITNDNTGYEGENYPKVEEITYVKGKYFINEQEYYVDENKILRAVVGTEVTDTRYDTEAATVTGTNPGGNQNGKGD